MKNPVQPSIELKVGSDVLLLNFDFEAIARAEEITDRALLTGLMHKQINQPTISFVRAMLFAGLLREHPEMTLEKASAMVTRKTFGPIWTKIVEAWVASIQEAARQESHPTPGQS